MSETSSIALRGGLDLSTPSVAKPDGSLLASRNYEADAAGYRRFQGYERFDGRPKPSEATYWRLGFDQGTSLVGDGETITGAISGATGVTVVAGVAESGSYGAGTAAGYLVLKELAGTFQDDESLEVSAAAVAVADGVATDRGVTDDVLDRQYVNAVAEARRSAIGEVPGSGPVRAVVRYQGDIYAIRDNADGTEAVFYKATASGWQALQFGEFLNFDNGTSEFIEGEVVTGANGASGVIRRILVGGGDWSSNDARGYFILSGVTNGPFLDDDALTGDLGGGAQVRGVSNGTNRFVPISPGGRYEFVIHNFFGSEKPPRLYGVGGTSRAFDWDGEYGIHVGIPGVNWWEATPAHVTVLNNNLLLGFEEGSVFVSGPGTPLDFRSIAGAAEFNFGESLTGLEVDSGVALFFGRTRISYLQGTSTDDFVYKELSKDSGADPYSVVLAGRPIYYGATAIRDMNAVDAFGDWRTGSLSARIQRLLEEYEANSVSVRASTRIRSRDLARWFMSDGTVLSLYLGRRDPEFTVLALPVTAFSAWDDEAGSFIGADDGFVYEMDIGASFDGEPVDYFSRLNFIHLGAPQWQKRWLGVRVELDAVRVASLAYIAEVDYAEGREPDGAEMAADITVSGTSNVIGGGGFWSEATWSDFIWSAPVVGTVQGDLDVIGRNLSLIIAGRDETTVEEPHTLTAVHFDWSPRGRTKRAV
jgi:hypothetical protein